ncbi:LysR family transcriptional regulator [Arsukibacterium sp.]|uniref:LysR family transcriptional regulator n=1 Tax=Arsukibacterium sp. TaxID=1977258 RepID=UPI002FD91618
MGFRQLRHIVALADSGSYAKASEIVHLSQSALSRSIQQSEQQFGINLFERGRFGAILTAHGEVALPHIRGLIAAEDALNQAVTALNGLQTGKITIGTGPYPAVTLINKVVPVFVEQFPDIQVTIKTDNWVNLRSQLIDNKVDLFIADIRELRNDPLLAIQDLPRMTGVTFCRFNHPLKSKTHLTWADLLAYPFAMPKLTTEVEQLFLAASQPFGGLTRRIECDNILLLLDIVMKSNAFSMAPYPVIAEHLKKGLLSTLEISAMEKLSTAFGVISKKQKQLSPAAAAFKELLMRQVVIDAPLHDHSNYA